MVSSGAGREGRPRVCTRDGTGGRSVRGGRNGFGGDREGGGSGSDIEFSSVRWEGVLGLELEGDTADCGGRGGVFRAGGTL